MKKSVYLFRFLGFVSTSTYASAAARGSLVFVCLAFALPFAILIPTALRGVVLHTLSPIEMLGLASVFGTIFLLASCAAVYCLLCEHARFTVERIILRTDASCHDYLERTDPSRHRVYLAKLKMLSILFTQGAGIPIDIRRLNEPYIGVMAKGPITRKELIAVLPEVRDWLLRNNEKTVKREREERLRTERDCPKSITDNPREPDRYVLDLARRISSGTQPFQLDTIGSVAGNA